MSAYIIKGGKLYNPMTHSIYEADLVIENGVIGSGIPSEPFDSAVRSEGDFLHQVIDASGCIVTTGFIDYHVHYFNHGTENGVNPDVASFPCGITTAVDCGSCGAANYELYRNSVMAHSDVTILNALLIASGGQTTEQYPERLEKKYIDREKIHDLFEQYPDNLIGLKTRLSAGIIEPGDAKVSLQATVELAEELKCPVIVHITNPVFCLEDMAAMLRKDDVICHVYQGKGRESILSPDGSIRTGIMEARRRGVLFDSSNGRNNYDLEVCQNALHHGFWPDIISSDMNTSGYYLQPLHSLPRVMSKYLDMGMSLEAVLDTVTVNPAKALKRTELASLEAGTTADIAIFKVKEKEIQYWDMEGHTFTGTRIIVPQMTIKNGNIVYCQADFT